MPEYIQVDTDTEPTTPPPYMDPGNSIAKKKSMVQHVKPDPISEKKSIAGINKRCDHCGAFPSAQHHDPIMIWPAPRPADHIRPDNSKFIGYVILIAVVIFLLFAACKYLP